MKKIIRSILATFVSIMMMFSLSTSVFAESIITAKEEQLIGDILNYYRYHTDGEVNASKGWTATNMNGNIDIYHCLDELESINPKLGQTYKNIMNYWFEVNTTMKINLGVLPDGLPNDNSLCIVTLGFQLNQQTGAMQDELVDRLNVAYNSAMKYPNAYIAVTGGGTSPADPTKTEGGEMAQWLIDHGIDSNRIITETNAKDTVGNAINTFALLKAKPEVKSVAMISTSSHVQRGMAIFN